MTITTQQLQKGIIDFVEKEIAQKATGIKKFGVYFFMPTIYQTVENYTVKLKGVMPTIFDGENINLDNLYNSSKEAIKKSGSVEFMGVIFNEADIDKLHYYIKSS